MDRCFVIQPFDGGVFDKRYEDVFVPALAQADLEAYRVDRDPNVTIPIEDIESGIRDSRICLADITLDNPNVWFELGYALSAGKSVVLVCATTRPTKFPFDVQHRSIIRYSSDSPRDFDVLKKGITTKALALLHREETLPKVSDMAVLAKMEGLDPHEIVALAALAENLDAPQDWAGAWQVKQDMERSGFTKVATTLAIKALIQKELITCRVSKDMDGDEYYAYSFTDTGWDWVLTNKDRFLLKRPPRGDTARNDDIPF